MLRSMRVGAYEVTGELGRGGSGVVHAGRAPDGRPVAIKLLAPLGQLQSRHEARFQRELDALRRLRHPGIVEFVDAGVHQGRPFLVTELVLGETLQARLDREGALSPAETIELGVELADALAHAHAANALHRDLKPENVLLGDDGRPRLIDFGLTRDLEASLGSLTVTGQLLGSPTYWSPEQARGARDEVGPWTDVWGLGGVLYAALTREPPLQGSSVIELCVAAADRPLVRPSERVRGVPRALEAVIVRCLQKEPRARYGSAAALREALRSCARSSGSARAAGAVVLGLGAALGLGMTLVVGAMQDDRAAPVASEAPAPPPVAPPTPPPATEAQPAPDVALVGSATAMAEVGALTDAGRFDEAERRLDRGPAVLFGGPPGEVALRSAIRVRRTIRAAVDLHNARRDLSLLEDDLLEVLAALDGLVAPDPALGQSSRVLALAALGRTDDALAVADAFPGAVSENEAVHQLLMALALRHPMLRAGAWERADPADAAEVARILTRLGAVPGVGRPGTIHLLRARAERARGDSVAGEAALREARMATRADARELRLAYAEEDAAAGRILRVTSELEALAATAHGEKPDELGRRARLLLRLAAAERALAADDRCEGAALVFGLAYDLQYAHDRDPLRDGGLTPVVVQRLRALQEDPRVAAAQQLGRRCGAAKSEAEVEALLRDAPPELRRATLVRSFVLAGLISKGVWRSRPAAEADAALAQVDELARVLGAQFEQRALVLLAQAGRWEEVRPRAAALVDEFPYVVDSVEMTLTMVELAVTYSGPALTRPAWSPSRQAAEKAPLVRELLTPWFEVQGGRRKEDRKTGLGLRLLARARAVLGDVAGAEAALGRAAGLGLFTALEQAALALATRRDFAAARDALRSADPTGPVGLVRVRLLQLADVEEALQAGDPVRARTLAATLVDDERTRPATVPFDEPGGSFLDLLEDALARAERAGQ